MWEDKMVEVEDLAAKDRDQMRIEGKKNVGNLGVHIIKEIVQGINRDINQEEEDHKTHIEFMLPLTIARPSTKPQLWSP